MGSLVLNMLTDALEAMQASPVWWLAMTLVVFQGAQWLYRRSRAFALFNPVLVSIVSMIALLLLSGTSYERYFADSQAIHLLLGPATVALAIPLYKQVAMVRAKGLPLLVSLVVGCVVAITTTVLAAQWLGLSASTVLSLAPKSVTTPIAMGVAEQVGGLPALTAALVIVTGIIGAVCAEPLLHVLGIKDDATKGFAIGLAAHGIGTARALQISEQAGAFSGLAMGLNGTLTALLVPLLLRWLGLS
jgi:predicted murein hydrolase (TIGR00659 family)